MDNNHELIIIGGGPAGLAAGIYAARARISTLLIEKGLPGGQIVNAELVENYPGFPNGISGAELVSLMEMQAVKYGLEITMAEVAGVSANGTDKFIKTDRDEYNAKAVIIASGSEYARLNVRGEDEFRGKGVSYCATCDGAFFRDKAVAVIGGGDVALNDALFLTRFTSNVKVIHRRDQLRATKILQERAFAEPSIGFIWDTVVEAISGEGHVDRLQLRNVKTGAKSALETYGVFIAVGFRPNTGYLSGFLSLSPEGFVVVNSRLETSVSGIFAAGDIRVGSPRQVVTAVGDGATAAILAQDYILSLV